MSRPPTAPGTTACSWTCCATSCAESGGHLDLELAAVDAGAAAGCLGRIHAVEDGLGVAHVLLRVERLHRDGGALRGVEEDLDAGRADPLGRPVGLVDARDE